MGIADRNPTDTRGAADSTSAFDQITRQMAETVPTTNRRDVIGYDWKEYSINNAQYTVHRWKNYMVYTRKGQIYKLHFLDYYNSAGQKGNPLFEYERLR